jgi:hypothetical protein
VASLAACGQADTGSMTKDEAIDKCRHAIAAAKTAPAGWRSDAADAVKEDRYWTVNGTGTPGGFYSCTINAVNRKILTYVGPL